MRSGDVIRWEQQLRFRHLATRQYLCITTDRRVTLTADSKDPRTVFRLHPVIKVHIISLSLSLSASPSVSAIHQQYRQYNNGDVRMAIDTLSVLSMRREWDGYWPVSAVVTGAVVHNSNVLRVLSKIMHEIARWWAAIWYNTRHRRRRRRTDSQRDRKIEPVVT